MWQIWAQQKYISQAVIDPRECPEAHHRAEYLTQVSYKLRVHVCQQVLRSVFPGLRFNGHTARVTLPLASAVATPRPLPSALEAVVRHLKATGFEHLMESLIRQLKRKQYEPAILAACREICEANGIILFPPTQRPRIVDLDPNPDPPEVDLIEVDAEEDHHDFPPSSPPIEEPPGIEPQPPSQSNAPETALEDEYGEDEAAAAAAEAAAAANAYPRIDFTPPSGVVEPARREIDLSDLVDLVDIGNVDQSPPQFPPVSQPLIEPSIANPYGFSQDDSLHQSNPFPDPEPIPPSPLLLSPLKTSVLSPESVLPTTKDGFAFFAAATAPFVAFHHSESDPVALSPTTGPADDQRLWNLVKLAVARITCHLQMHRSSEAEAFYRQRIPAGAVRALEQKLRSATRGCAGGPLPQTEEVELGDGSLYRYTLYDVLELGCADDTPYTSAAIQLRSRSLLELVAWHFAWHLRVGKAELFAGAVYELQDIQRVLTLVTAVRNRGDALQSLLVVIRDTVYRYQLQSSEIQCVGHFPDHVPTSEEEEVRLVAALGEQLTGGAILKQGVRPPLVFRTTDATDTTARWLRLMFEVIHCLGDIWPPRTLKESWAPTLRSGFSLSLMLVLLHIQKGNVLVSFHMKPNAARVAQTREYAPASALATETPVGVVFHTLELRTHWVPKFLSAYDVVPQPSISMLSDRVYQQKLAAELPALGPARWFVIPVCVSQLPELDPHQLHHLLTQVAAFLPAKGIYLSKKENRQTPVVELALKENQMRVLVAFLQDVWAVPKRPSTLMALPVVPNSDARVAGFRWQSSDLNAQVAAW